MATHLFRIAQEAVNNALKHGRPTAISISLIAASGQLTLTIEDDGCGISAGSAGTLAGMGLHIMRYRARAIGGSLSVDPQPKGGTSVSCRLPCPAL